MSRSNHRSQRKIHNLNSRSNRNGYEESIQKCPTRGSYHGKHIIWTYIHTHFPTLSHTQVTLITQSTSTSMSFQSYLYSLQPPLERRPRLIHQACLFGPSVRPFVHLDRCLVDRSKNFPSLFFFLLVQSSFLFPFCPRASQRTYKFNIGRSAASLTSHLSYAFSAPQIRSCVYTRVCMHVCKAKPCPAQ